MTAPYWLNTQDPTDFPAVKLALTEPDGLLAVGGDLSEQRLLTAYRKGIFPWYSEEQPILWWSPNPRAVLFPKDLKISKSLRKKCRQQIVDIRFDTAFEQVVRACAEPRQRQTGTWITDEMRDAYVHLHQAGHAHSVECWQKGHLVGGLYGISIGKIFFGESMFSRISDASKIAFVHLVKHLEKKHYALIDCQVGSSHLSSLGASYLDRAVFIDYLNQYCPQSGWPGPWQLDSDIEQSILS